eukprot:761665-Hanusia_phi.AAC.2
MDPIIVCPIASLLARLRPAVVAFTERVPEALEVAVAPRLHGLELLTPRVWHDVAILSRRMNLSRTLSVIRVTCKAMSGRRAKGSSGHRWTIRTCAGRACTRSRV